EPHPLALLRTGDNRASSSRPTEKYDELAPPHCLPRSSGHAIVAAQTWIGKDPAHVRFASLADIQAGRDPICDRASAKFQARLNEKSRLSSRLTPNRQLS